ncbi:unnamed protein product [Prorocentrum cordatum]|uniref:RING-type E3 ubiquitin transferase n=1 Tax=Prorocentrum cordatum TaxID=2364126 RepID=A0ABN9TXV0_9DINO|nr:unnamed protein product [Polarella glacialis]
MLRDLLPRALAFGRCAPKAIPVVADTMVFIASLTTPIWRNEETSKAENSEAVVRACLAELDAGAPSQAGAAMQVLACLLHRRPQVAVAVGDEGAKGLLMRLHGWSCDCVLDALASSSSAATGPTVEPPTWLTQVVVCQHQLLQLVDLTKVRDSREAMDSDSQTQLVHGVLGIVLAYPEMDSGLALACLQVLTHLCSTTVGARAFLDFARDPSPEKQGHDVAGGLRLLLRMARPAAFDGLPQMVASLVLLLLEDGPLLQQRMEAEILALLGAARKRQLPMRDLCSRLQPLLARAPRVFEETLRGITQIAQSHEDGAGTVLEPIPEAERPQRPRPRAAGSLPAAALPVLQTLIFETCIGLEIQSKTSFTRVHEAATKTVETEPAAAAAATLPPPFPAALAPDALLFVLESVFARVPALGALLLRPLPALPQAALDRQLAVQQLLAGRGQAAAGAGDGGEPAQKRQKVEGAPAPAAAAADLPNAPAVASLPPSALQKSMLLVLTRHLLPRFAGLTGLWTAQVRTLAPAQRATLDRLPGGAAGTVHRCLPHLGACLASAVRHPGRRQDAAQGKRERARPPRRGWPLRLRAPAAARGELSFDFELEVEAKDALRRARLEESGHGSRSGTGREVCRHWLKGLCMRGDRCSFLHAWDSRKMPECSSWRKFGSCTDPFCIFRHVDPSERPLCESYRLGFCPRGKLCRGRHDRLPPEQRPVLLPDSFIDSLLLNPHLVPQASKAKRGRHAYITAMPGQDTDTAAVDQGPVPGLPSPIHGECRYFLVRSTKIKSIRTSMSKGVWAVSHEATPRLELAFRDVDHVVLIFAAAESRQFHGYARMSSEPEDRLLSGIWEENGSYRIGPNFRVHWIKRCAMGQSRADHIKNPRDADLPVLQGRKTTHMYTLSEVRSTSWGRRSPSS